MTPWCCAQCRITYPMTSSFIAYEIIILSLMEDNLKKSFRCIRLVEERSKTISLTLHFIQKTVAAARTSDLKVIKQPYPISQNSHYDDCCTI